MVGGTGLAPHPTDCSKFINCWKGTAHTQQCGPGTLFNPQTLQCDFPYNVNCIVSTPGPQGELCCVETNLYFLTFFTSENCSLNPSMTRCFFLFQRVQTDSRAHPACCSTCTWGSVPEGKTSRVWNSCQV